MIETDRTVNIGDHVINLKEENVYHITIVGDINEGVALEFVNVLESLENTFGKKQRNVFVDNNKAGKISSKARKIFQSMKGNDTTGKVAIFGLHPVARVLASFFIGISGNKKMQFFNSKERALEWLRS